MYHYNQFQSREDEVPDTVPTNLDTHLEQVPYNSDNLSWPSISDVPVREADYPLVTGDSFFYPNFYTPEIISLTKYDIPDELVQISSGDSVLEAESVVGDYGRTYHGYKEGKYLLPNDAV
jgi:hypothetical protein